MVRQGLVGVLTLRCAPSIFSSRVTGTEVLNMGSGHSACSRSGLDTACAACRQPPPHFSRLPTENIDMPPSHILLPG